MARADVPATARPLDWSQGPPPSNPVAAPSGSQTTGQKRKIDAPESSQTNMPSSSAPHPQSQVTDLADSDEEFGNDPIEIAADELYLGLETQVCDLLREEVVRCFSIFSCSHRLLACNIIKVRTCNLLAHAFLRPHT